MRELVRGTAALTRLAWRASRARFALALTLMLVQYASLPLAAPALAALTDAAISRDSNAVTTSALAVAALAIMTLTAGHFGRVVAFELGELVQLAIEQELITLSNGSPGIEHLERPDYADRLAVIRQDIDWSGWPTVNRLFSAMGFSVGAAVTVVLLTTLTPWLLLLPVCALPSLMMGRRAETVAAQSRRVAAPHSRRANHVVQLATEASTAVEVRACDLTEELRARQRSVWSAASATILRGETRASVLRGAGHAVFAVAYIAATLLVVRRVVAGHGSVGDVVLAITLAAQVNQQVTFAASLLAGMQRSARTQADLEWLRTLVAPRPHQADLTVPSRLQHGITFRNVDFGYPGAAEHVLEGVSLHLPAGLSVAIVGENGAGKTTLVKLLARFYEPSSGVIEIDGVDAAHYSVAEWRTRMAAGFQDFARFEFTARATVGVGDLPHIDDSDAVNDALERAQANTVVSNLTRGLDTPLGTSHVGGALLSGGQWQKLALARAMMRRRPLLLVLDEPTSALDAQAEHDLFAAYAASATAVAKETGGITVLVSHRFSTVRMADMIVVVDGGRIQESGTHEQLMARKGIYASLFSLQAQAYS